MFYYQQTKNKTVLRLKLLEKLAIICGSKQGDDVFVGKT